MTGMPHLQSMGWNFAEQLSHIAKGTDEAHYCYDGTGQRVRKVVMKNGKREERLYLGGFEIFRKYDAGDALETERETLHIMDDAKRIAIVDTLTVENGQAVANTVLVQRYQLSNNIESATLELDETANIISYEEYYPYGETSYRAGRSTEEVSRKRYRYTGKEKDEESGLYYHGARYYACWIGRWTAADPIGVGDGVNLYAYCRGNPVKLVDPRGMAGVDLGKEMSFEPVEVKGDGTNVIGGITGGARGGVNLSNEFNKKPETDVQDVLKTPELPQRIENFNVKIDIIEIKANLLGKQPSASSSSNTKYSTRKMQIIKESTGGNFKVDKNPNADGAMPINEFSYFSEVGKYNEYIENAALEKNVDSDLIRSIMYMETTHGYYDVIPELFDANKSILPMNVNEQYWGNTFGDRNFLKNPENNINAGAEMLRRISDNVETKDIDKISTLYNNINAKKVSDYGARVMRIYKDKPWLKK